MSAPELRKVVFDIDDIVWGSQRVVAREFNIPFELLDEFHILENSKLTYEQRLAINAYYGGPKFGRNIEFYPGFEKILELEKFGAIIQFNSNGFSVTALNDKRDRIRAVLPNVRPEQFRFNLVDGSTTIKKKFDDDSFIVIDDSPYNIAQSPALHNIMPIVPWTQTAKARQIVRDKNVHYVPEGDLESIYNLVRQLLST